MLCKECGVTLDDGYEQEDGLCAQCVEDVRRREAKVTFKKTIEALSMLQDEDWTQDQELCDIHEELCGYFRG